MRGAAVGHCVIQSDESGVFLRMNMRADYSDTLRESMGWDPLGAHSRSMDLEGQIGGGRLRLSSQQQQIDGSFPEMQISIDEVSAFRAVRVKDKDQEATRVELRFQIRSRAEEAAALAYAYKSSAKKSLGELRISQSDAPMQTVSDERQDSRPIDNALNAAGSGRKKEKGRRGAPVAAAVVSIEPDERKKVEQIIDKSLQ